MKITHIVIHYYATYEDQNYTVKDIDKMNRGNASIAAITVTLDDVLTWAQ